MTYEFNHQQIEQFKASYPCSGIPELESIAFEFEGQVGQSVSLVDVCAIGIDGAYIDSAEFDGPALLALSQDAQRVIEAL